MNIGGDRGAENFTAEINVTPLVDVMLVLLVIFMITAPMLSVGMKVDLPESAAADPIGESGPVVITVRKDSTIAVGSSIVAREGLIAAVKKELEGNASRIVQLRGDSLAVYGDVVFVMGELSSNGITRIAVETAPAQGG